MGGLETAPAEGTIDRGWGPSAGSRVLVVFEPCRTGTAALREGAQLANAGSELWVVTLAPQARPLRCCGGGGAGPYNCAVRGAAETELREARRHLGSVAARATFTVLVGSPDPPLAAWVHEQAVDLILLPSRRLTLHGGPLARGLRRETDAEVRLIR